MSLGPIRPRFRWHVAGTVDEQIMRVEAAAGRPEARCVSRTVGPHVDVTVVPEDRHRWSPCVHLEFNATDDGTVVDGLVGPHPNVWTLFAFANMTLVFILAFGLTLGLVQRSIDQPAWGLWIVPASVVGLAALYVASQFGRRFAREQTRHLTTLVHSALEPGATASSEP